MKISLEGQTAAITGAARGIGRAITEALIEAGAKVIAIDRDPLALEELSASSPGNIEALCADVADFESLKAGISGRRIDHLVCAAAVGSGKGGLPFWNLEPKDWQRVVDVTLMGSVNAIHA